MATIQYARLYPDTTQLQAKDGHNLTAGWVEVYLAGTDDPAVTYADFNGTRNPQKIPVDDNGRFTAIVDKSKAYRVEVYDSEGMLQWTTEPVWCTGNAGAGISVTRVISTDGSIDVEEQIDGSERTYDLSLAPPDNDEYLEWIKCSEEDCGSTWYPVYQAGTMETEAGQGIKVHGGHLYHFTSTFYVDPDGTGINYDTFKVTMYCNDEIVDVRDFDIDSSLNDSVQCEFSTDVIPPEDGVVYYKLTIPSTCEVTAEVQCHRIYSGINAVPDSCAAKPWVSEYFEEKSSMSAYIPYSGLEYNQGGDITGISGSAIYAALDSGTVSAIASSYAESAFSSISGWSGDFSSISSKIDWSSSGVFQPSGDYQTAGDYAYNSSLSSKVDQSAFDQCCDDVHSALDEKLDKSASSEFQPSGDYVYESSYSSFSSDVTNNISSLSSTVSGISADMSAYVPFSGLEYNDNGDISGISGSSIAGGLDSAAVSSIASSYAESAISSISGWSGDFSSISSKIDWSSSGVFQPSGDYAYNSSLSSKVDQSAFEQCCAEVHSALDDKLDKSASGEFQPSGNYVYESAYSSFSSEVTNNITSISSTVSGLTGQYIEQSASSMFQPSGNYASASDLSAYVPFSGLEGEGGRVTGISGSAIKGHEYTGINPVVVDNTADTISVEHRTLCVDSTMTAYNSGSSVVIGVNTAGLDLSSKMDASASSLFYPMDNPSGFITGVDLTPYQLTADMSAYQLSGDYAFNSSVSSKADASSLSSYQPTSAMSAYATESWASGEISAKLDVTASSLFLTSLPADLAYTSDVASAVSGKLDASASSGFYPMTGNPSGFLTAHQSLAGLATEEYVDSAVSSKLDATAYDSAEFYTTSNPSGFVDSAYVESQVSGKQNSGDYLTAKVGSGQATFSTAFQDGMDKRPALVISAQRIAGSSMYPRMLVTDWNNTTGETHSGALLANAFEFYSCPDSARGEVDPSGLVQSRLDASHLRFNVDPAISSYTKSSEYTRYGMRLGSAGNSASWAIVSGDGPNGGFIILNDGSGMSGRIIASSIPYWNDKLDGSASSSFYTTANESGYVDSAYVESKVSGKQDTLTFDWDADSAISSINGSALAGQGGGSVTGDYVENSALDSVTAYSATGGVSSMATGISSISGQPLIPTYLANPTYQYGGQSTFVYMPASSIWTTADAATGVFSPLQYATGACLAMNAGHFKAYYKGNEWFVSDDRYGYARGEVHQSRGCRVIVEHTAGAGAVLSAKNTQANVTLNSTAYGTAQMAVANSQAYVQVQRSNHNSKYNSAKLDTDYLKFYNGMATGYLDPEDTASGTSYLPAETEYMYISSIPYWNGKMDSAEMSAYVAKSAYDDLYSAFTALSGVISTYSGWFSELSSISAKVDNSAIGVIE